MNKPASVRIAVIGTGFLMTYLDSCIKRLAGDAGSIVGVSNTAQTAERKTKELGYRVVCQNHLETLQQTIPDLILFSPPPSAARDLAQSVLRTYYAWVRERGFPLPDLYAFPPNPLPSYYREVLGADVQVVNLLPNMATRIGDFDISQQSYSVVIHPEGARYAPLFRERLETFLTPIGYLLDVPDSHGVDLLGGFVASHMVQELSFAMADGLAQAGFPVPFSALAGAMRAQLCDLAGRTNRGAISCSSESVPQELRALTSQTIAAWLSGIIAFGMSRGMDEALCRAVAVPQLDIFLQSAQCRSRSEIQGNNSQHATKGGLLERGLAFFQDALETPLVRLFSLDPDKQQLSPAGVCQIEQAAHQLSREIWLRGLQLADQ